MLTTRSAAQFLSAAESIDGLTAIARLLGCASPAAQVGIETRSALGLADAVLHAAICAGTGALRALLIEADGSMPMRTLAENTAARLARCAPHVLWLVAITQPVTNAVALAAWAGDTQHPRIRALLCDRLHIVDSDAETLRALAAATGDGDLMTHARWVELLGRETLTRRFYVVLHDCVQRLAESGLAGEATQMRELALLHVSRLLFLAFLQAKGWLDGDPAFLPRQFDRCMQSGGRFHDRVLLPLFFGTLNTPARSRAARARAFGRVPFLNGGLFTRTPLERAWRHVRFSDDAYGVLLSDVFGRYRFTAREDQATWSEAAVDPEMLGRAFEGLMAHTDRKASGTFYTPHGMVRRLTEQALSETLIGHPRAKRLTPGLAGHGLVPADALQLRAHLEHLTIVDPACGSGAFLVDLLERIARLLVVHGDARAETLVRRAVLAHSIFGVDANPVAVWLCELRLWLSVLIDSEEPNPARVSPLPNLDLNIRVGDALAGDGDMGRPQATTLQGSARSLRDLRERYARATGPRKVTLARELSKRERARALAELDAALASVQHRRRDLVSVRRTRTLFGERTVATRDQRQAALGLRREAAGLRRARVAMARGGPLPFSWRVYFPDVAAAGGFDLVIGNPPWVRLHEIPLATRAMLRSGFEVARAAPWMPETGAESRTPGFGAQLDLSAVFLERACELARAAGTIGLLLPSKLWSSLAGAGARRIVTARARLLRLEDLTDAPESFDAAVYPSMLIARRLDGPPVPAHTTASELTVGIHHRHTLLQWQTTSDGLAYDASPGAPWLLAPPPVRRAFDRVRHGAASLGAAGLGAARLGVKCGHNGAFVVRVIARDGEVAAVEDERGQRAWIERDLLRPLVRGDSVTPWSLGKDDAAIIWTHAGHGGPLAELPPYAARWFTRRRRDLETRTDARRAVRWWSLFRTEAARMDTPRVVWCDMGRAPRAAFLAAGDATVPLNTCYAMRCKEEVDALALVALLNSPLTAAWLSIVAEPARGGYRRYLGWTVSLLPMPRPWHRARGSLAALTTAALRGEPPEPRHVLDVTCSAFGVRSREMQALLAWSRR